MAITCAASLLVLHEALSAAACCAEWVKCLSACSAIPDTLLHPQTASISAAPPLQPVEKATLVMMYENC